MSFHRYKRFATGVFVVLVYLGLVFVPAHVSAQTTKIFLSKRQVTLSELFGEIKRQTGITVVFDEGTVPHGRVVSLARRDGTVTELLDRALTASGYTWQAMGHYILVRGAADPRPQAASPTPPQPTGAEFERDIRNYTRENIPAAGHSGKPAVIYDTIRTERPHSGVFTYPAQNVTPRVSLRAAQTPFTRDTPPIFAVKTNLAWWAAGGTLNIAGEVGLGKRTSLELSGGNNRWNFKGSAGNNKKLTHMIIKPEFRYWLCERFSGHFFGLHALYGRYNVGGHAVPMLFEKEFRYEGDAWGGGVSYGYHLPLAKRLGVEFTAGVGVASLDYKKFDCDKCGSEVDRLQKTYFGPTSLGLKVIFMIK